MNIAEEKFLYWHETLQMPYTIKIKSVSIGATMKEL